MRCFANRTQKHRDTGKHYCPFYQLFLFTFSLRSANEQVELYKRKLDALDDYEHQIRVLEDKVFYLNSEKNRLQDRYTATQVQTQPVLMQLYLFYFHSSGWCEAAPRAPCPSSAARPAP